MVSFGIEKFVVDEAFKKDIKKEQEMHLRYSARKAVYEYFHPEAFVEQQAETPAE